MYFVSMGFARRHLSCKVSDIGPFAEASGSVADPSSSSSLRARGTYDEDIAASSSSPSAVENACPTNRSGRGRTKKYASGVMKGRICSELASDFMITIKSKGIRTVERPTPKRTPKPLSSHQSNAPASPAPPVPEAKYLAFQLV